MLRALMAHPSEPYEMTTTTYLHLVYAGVHRLGSFSVAP